MCVYGLGTDATEEDVGIADDEEPALSPAKEQADATLATTSTLLALAAGVDAAAAAAAAAVSPVALDPAGEDSGAVDGEKEAQATTVLGHWRKVIVARAEGQETSLTQLSWEQLSRFVELAEQRCFEACELPDLGVDSDEDEEDVEDDEEGDQDVKAEAKDDVTNEERLPETIVDPQISPTFAAPEGDEDTPPTLAVDVTVTPGDTVTHIEATDNLVGACRICGKTTPCECPLDGEQEATTETEINTVPETTVINASAQQRKKRCCSLQ